MVSSKWIQGESPSPLVLTAPLMPPCAHTEWERLTGTMENRSTRPPASATLIVAIKPASPPPTTITLSLAKCLNPLAEEIVADESGHRPDAEASSEERRVG